MANIGAKSAPTAPIVIAPVPEATARPEGRRRETTRCYEDPDHRPPDEIVEPAPARLDCPHPGAHRRRHRAGEQRDQERDARQ